MVDRRRQWRAENQDLSIEKQFNQQTYIVNGSRGIDYIVDTEKPACECPDWRDREPEGGCKHILKVKLEEGSLSPLPSAKTGDNSPEHKSSDPYPSDWEALSNQVRQRDNWECQKCGVDGSSEGDAIVQAHHIIPRSKGGADTVENLITLCKGCHEAEHGHEISELKSTSNKRSVSKRESGPINNCQQSSDDHAGDTAPIAYDELYIHPGAPDPAYVDWWLDNTEVMYNSVQAASNDGIWNTPRGTVVTESRIKWPYPFDRFGDEDPLHSAPRLHNHEERITDVEAIKLRIKKAKEVDPQWDQTSEIADLLFEYDANVLLARLDEMDITVEDVPERINADRTPINTESFETPVTASDLGWIYPFERYGDQDPISVFQERGYPDWICVYNRMLKADKSHSGWIKKNVPRIVDLFPPYDSLMIKKNAGITPFNDDATQAEPIKMDVSDEAVSRVARNVINEMEGHLMLPEVKKKARTHLRTNLDEKEVFRYLCMEYRQIEMNNVSDDVAVSPAPRNLDSETNYDLNENVLIDVIKYIRSNTIGNEEQFLLLTLGYVSSLMINPADYISTVMIGTSSSVKMHLTDRVVELFELLDTIHTSADLDTSLVYSKEWDRADVISMGDFNQLSEEAIKLIEHATKGDEEAIFQLTHGDSVDDFNCKKIIKRAKSCHLTHTQIDMDFEFWNRLLRIPVHESESKNRAMGQMIFNYHDIDTDTKYGYEFDAGTECLQAHMLEIKHHAPKQVIIPNAESGPIDTWGVIEPIFNHKNSEALDVYPIVANLIKASALINFQARETVEITAQNDENEHATTDALVAEPQDIANVCRCIKTLRGTTHKIGVRKRSVIEAIQAKGGEDSTVNGLDPIIEYIEESNALHIDKTEIKTILSKLDADSLITVDGNSITARNWDALGEPRIFEYTEHFDDCVDPITGEDFVGSWREYRSM